MEFIIQLFANNEIRCKVQTEASKTPKPTDKTKDREATRRAILLEEGGDIRRVIRNHFNVPVGYSHVQEAVAWQLATDGSRHEVAFETVSSPVYPAVVVLADGNAHSGYDVKQYNYDDCDRRLKTILDITKKSQREPSHWNWGKPQTPKAFGSHGRHRVLESGAVIDREKPRDSTYELTLTLPGSTPEAIAAVAAWSGWIVNRQLQSVRRLDKNKEIWWFFVWEFQKRGALHQHWCVAADTPELAYEAAMQLKALWYKCLHELLDKIGVDCYQRKGFGTWRDNPSKWQWHCQRVKKSVAAYFSKYTCKGSENVVREAAYTRRGKIQYPSRWWGSSSQVKLAVKSWRKEAKISGIPREMAEYLRCKVLSLTTGLRITKQYQYDFDIVGRIPTNRNETKNRRVSYCSGNVWIQYVEPDRWPDIWQQLSDILGSSEERAKGTTPMQYAASLYSEEEGYFIKYKPFTFGLGANSLP